MLLKSLSSLSFGLWLAILGFGVTLVSGCGGETTKDPATLQQEADAMEAEVKDGESSL